MPAHTDWRERDRDYRRRDYRDDGSDDWRDGRYDRDYRDYRKRDDRDDGRDDWRDRRRGCGRGRTFIAPSAAKKSEFLRLLVENIFFVSDNQLNKLIYSKGKLFSPT